MTKHNTRLSSTNFNFKGGRLRLAQDAYLLMYGEARRLAEVEARGETTTSREDQT